MVPHPSRSPLHLEPPAPTPFGASAQANPSRTLLPPPPHTSLSKARLGEALPERNLDIDTTPSCCRIFDLNYYFRCPAGSRNRRTSSTVRVLTAEVLPVAVLIVNDYIDLEIGSRTTTSTTIFDR